jgi:hypothetical protein
MEEKMVLLIMLNAPCHVPGRKSSQPMSLDGRNIEGGSAMDFDEFYEIVEKDCIAREDLIAVSP